MAAATREVVTEFPSSPLFEALAGSVPVVAMETPFINYTEKILSDRPNPWWKDLDDESLRGEE